MKYLLQVIIALSILGLVLSYKYCELGAAFLRRTSGRQLYANLDKNYVFSPASALSLLTMIYFGVSGKALNEFNQVLAYKNISQRKIERTIYDLHKRNIRVNGKLSISSRLYLNTKFPLTESYTDLINEVYGLPPENINFSMYSYSTINDWIAEKTNQKIRNLIHPGAISSLTRAAFVNAIYLKAPWKHPFLKELTRKMNFYVTSEKTVKVDMMTKQGYFQYVEWPRLNARAIKLDLDQTNIKLIIILPNEHTSLATFYQHFSTFDHTKPSHRNYWRKRKVQVFLPKFKIETEINLKSELQKLGLDEIFTGNPDFNPITTSNDTLIIDYATQKATIDVNEVGLEATAAGFVEISAHTLPSKIFKADRPFLFLLSDDDFIYFIGQVVTF